MPGKQGICGPAGSGHDKPSVQEGSGDRRNGLHGRLSPNFAVCSSSLISIGQRCLKQELLVPEPAPVSAPGYPCTACLSAAGLGDPQSPVWAGSKGKHRGQNEGDRIRIE